MSLLRVKKRVKFITQKIFILFIINSYLVAKSHQVITIPKMLRQTLIVLIILQSSQCIMKGLCEKAAFGHIPCVFNGPPAIMSDQSARSILKEICPDLASEESLCCDAEQIIDLKNHAELFGLFLKQCPACFANYQHILCHTTCSPKQAEFVKLLRNATNDDGKAQIVEVDVFLAQNFADGFLKSCEKISRFGETVLDVFCKPWSIDKCNSLRMLKYLGSDFDHQGHSPYQIDYVLSKDNHIKWDGDDHPVVQIKPFKCSDSINGQPKCDC